MKIFKVLRKVLVLGILILAFIYHKDISNYIIKNYVYNKNITIEIIKNEYAKNENYGFIQITDDFIAKDYQHLLNIFYTIIDSGENSFYFYCDDAYLECISDINNLIPDNSNQSIMSEINNFVHPYNSYQTITLTTNNFGKVTIQITKQYSNENIKYVNNQIESIKKSILTNGMDNKSMILAFHNYIINNTKYDTNRADNMNDIAYKNSTTHTAFGLLETKKALCGGYSDLMSIFISQLGMNNIRISANNHVWNLLFLDKWLHLDATWDDPITNTGDEFLIHDYFLITTVELQKADEIEHNFNPTIYIEAK